MQENSFCKKKQKQKLKEKQMQKNKFSNLFSDVMHAHIHGVVAVALLAYAAVTTLVLISVMSQENTLADMRQSIVAEQDEAFLSYNSADAAPASDFTFNGFDPSNTKSPTGGFTKEIYAGKYLVLYGSFMKSGNTVLISGKPVNLSPTITGQYESKTQINVKLADTYSNLGGLYQTTINVNGAEKTLIIYPKGAIDGDFRITDFSPAGDTLPVGTTTLPVYLTLNQAGNCRIIDQNGKSANMTLTNGQFVFRIAGLVAGTKYNYGYSCVSTNLKDRTHVVSFASNFSVPASQVSLAPTIKIEPTGANAPTAVAGSIYPDNSKPEQKPYKAIYDADGPNGPKIPEDVTKKAQWGVHDSKIAAIPLAADGKTQVKGYVAALAPGRTGITAFYNGVGDTSAIIVTAKPVKVYPTLTITPTSAQNSNPNSYIVTRSVFSGFTAMYDADGTGPAKPVDVTKDAAWSVVDSSIAQLLKTNPVSNTTKAVKGIKAGKTSVVAIYNSIKDVSNIVVIQNPDAGVEGNWDDNGVVPAIKPGVQTTVLPFRIYAKPNQALTFKSITFVMKQFPDYLASKEGDFTGFNLKQIGGDTANLFTSFKDSSINIGFNSNQVIPAGGYRDYEFSLNPAANLVNGQYYIFSLGGIFLDAKLDVASGDFMNRVFIGQNLITGISGRILQSNGQPASAILTSNGVSAVTEPTTGKYILERVPATGEIQNNSTTIKVDVQLIGTNIKTYFYAGAGLNNITPVGDVTMPAK